jgi:hypothetical protein
MWWGAAGLLSVGSVAVILGAWRWPYAVPQQPGAGLSQRPSAAAPAPPRSLPPLSEFEPVWKVRLRSAPANAPGSRAFTQAPQSPLGLPIRLAGTVVEPDHSFAIFITSVGKIELKKIGETIADARVLEISDGSVSLSYRGQTVNLPMEKKTGRRL